METMSMALNSCRTAEKSLRETAEKDFAIIKARDEAEKAAKKAMESYGVFDDIEKAAAYVQSKTKISEYPLYIRINEYKDKKQYEVKELVLKDADGVPIHNGDAIFLPDDTFFRIQFTSSIPTENDSLIDKIFYRGVAEEGYEEYFPEKLKKYPVQEMKLDDDYIKSLFRIRMWTNLEKQDYLENELKQRILLSLKDEKRAAIVCLVGSGIMLICLLLFNSLFWIDLLEVPFLLMLVFGAIFSLDVMDYTKFKDVRLSYLKNLATNCEINKTIFHKELQKNRIRFFVPSNKKQDKESLLQCF